MTYLIIAEAFVMGACFGSFLRVAIKRSKEHRSFVTGRSICDNCGCILSWYDLIPLFSYIILRGKCRHCGDKIAVGHFLWELLFGVVSAAIMLVALMVFT